MVSRRSLIYAVPAIAGVAAQQMGKMTPEVHPKLPTWECTVKGGCVEKSTAVVLDSDYRWLHTVNGTENCKGQGLSKTLCPDAKTCAANCVLEGADYASYGIVTNGSEVTLNLFVNKTTGVSMSSPRIYLLANESTYQMYSMLNREFSFDVDLSKLPCGTNGALYFSEMLANGGKSELNPAGATYGTGYCDAQCPTAPFINGEANMANAGACCNEMDLWEANKMATAFTPHPCNVTGVYKCSGALCGSPDRHNSVCDKDGCDYNPYRLGQQSFYQPNATLDTNKTLTVVTQFITTNGNDTGDLREIRRIYIQDGKVIENALAQVQGIDKGNSLTDEFCSQQRKAFGGTNTFLNQGGMKGMGEALRRGMVLAMSVWDDAGGSMHWLDSTSPDTADPRKDLGTGRGPCSADAGKVANIEKNASWTQVKFSNIKSGEIGSTFKGKSGNVV